MCNTNTDIEDIIKYPDFHKIQPNTPSVSSDQMIPFINEFVNEGSHAESTKELSKLYKKLRLNVVLRI